MVVLASLSISAMVCGKPRFTEKPAASAAGLCQLCRGANGTRRNAIPFASAVVWDRRLGREINRVH